MQIVLSLVSSILDEKTRVGKEEIIGVAQLDVGGKAFGVVKNLDMGTMVFGQFGVVVRIHHVVEEI
jgi:hypothetical protein